MAPTHLTLPPQQRGRTRRARIVRATSLLIDSAPSSGRRPLTLRAIAEAADTPVASIYHYFPDVDAIVAAAAAQYGSELLAAVEAGVSRPAPSLRTLLDSIFAIYREFFAARPGLREMWFDRRASDHVIDIHRAFRADLARTLHAAMREFATEPHDILDHQIWIEITGTLWEIAFRSDPDGDPKVVAEIHEFSERFLRRRLGATFAAVDEADRDGAYPGRARKGPSRGSGSLPDAPPAENAPADRAPAHGPSSPAQDDDREPHPWETELPPQARGRKRREQILAAASAIIDAQGPRGRDMHVRAIADAAGTSPGSMYRYFADLDSLVAAVAASYMHDLIDVIDAVDAGSEGLDHAALNARTVDAYRVFFAQRPGLRELWFDGRASEKVQDIHAHYRRLLARRKQRTLARYVSAPGDLADYTMNVEVMSGLWDLAFTLDPQGHPYVIGEIEESGLEFVRRLRERAT